jgi:hypothetical protein
MNWKNTEGREYDGKTPRALSKTPHRMVDVLAEIVNASQKKPYHLKHVAGNFIAFQINVTTIQLLTHQHELRITCYKVITDIQAAALCCTHKVLLLYLR